MRTETKIICPNCGPLTVVDFKPPQCPICGTVVDKEETRFLVCELCAEKIATIRPGIHLPLTGGMFGSPDERHGFPEPFSPALGWEDLRCPHCRFRPMIEPNRILTDKGYYELKPLEEGPELESVEERLTREAEQSTPEHSAPSHSATGSNYSGQRSTISGTICPECGKTCKNLGAHRYSKHGIRREA